MYLQFSLWQWGAGNVHLLVLFSWKVNIAQNLINGVVDTFGPSRCMVAIWCKVEVDGGTVMAICDNSTMPLHRATRNTNGINFKFQAL